MRYRCHECAWKWPIHMWLPFDFELARAAYHRHVRRNHQPPPSPMARVVLWCGRVGILTALVAALLMLGCLLHTLPPADAWVAAWFGGICAIAFTIGMFCEKKEDR